VIAGPTLTENEAGWQYAGIGFTANTAATLTGFTFQNQGKADNVILMDAGGNVLQQAAIPEGLPSATISVSWLLSAGSQYYLLKTTETNALWADWSLPAPSNADITLTDTGIFSHSPQPADFDFDITGTGHWAAFNNITTAPDFPESSTVPEPSTVLMLGMGLLGLARLRRPL
jgi:hypothetical protein